MWDIAVIGAGLAGLTCARQLRRSGHQVCVLDKSKGLGGRIATRRVTGLVRIDHGLRYWPAEASDALLAPLTRELIEAGVIKQWAANAYELRSNDELVAVQQDPVYVASSGMSAIAKYLAQGFIPDETLLNSYRAVKMAPCGLESDPGWKITCEDDKVVMARKCVLAIPALQAVALLSESTDTANSIDSEALVPLQAVQYNPRITILAGYGDLKLTENTFGKLRPDGCSDGSSEGWMVTDTIGTSTEWIGLDSSKRSRSDVEPTLVIHSKTDFAHRYIDAGDLQPAASVLLRASARKYGEWIAQPSWFQIHRWRYAYVSEAYEASYCQVSPSLLCGGDWCVNQTVKHPVTAAYLSGLAMAKAVA